MTDLKKEDLMSGLFGKLPVQEEDKDKIVDLLIDDLVEFHSNELGKQPFNVDTEADSFKELLASIKDNGVLDPIIVRPNPEMTGKYEIISGHRRVTASLMENLETIPGIIKDMDDDTANIFVAAGNITRTDAEIKPTEKGWAFRFMIDALNHQGKKASIENATRTREEVAKKTGVSQATIHRLIRLTYLVPDLREMVDNGNFPLIAGENLSYLNLDQQDIVVSVIVNKKVTVNAEQAGILKTLSKEKPDFTENDVYNILKKIKKDTSAVPKFNEKYLTTLFPAVYQSLPADMKMLFIENALKQYSKYLADNPEEVKEYGVE